jgi:hypothetical protein
MRKQTPRPLQLGSIAKAYTDELAEHGEDAMNKRAEETMDVIVERFRSGNLDLISWQDITEKFQFCIYPSPHCTCDEHAKPSLFRRIAVWFRRIFS